MYKFKDGDFVKVIQEVSEWGGKSARGLESRLWRSGTNWHPSMTASVGCVFVIQSVTMYGYRLCYRDREGNGFYYPESALEAAQRPEPANTVERIMELWE